MSVHIPPQSPSETSEVTCIPADNPPPKRTPPTVHYSWRNFHPNAKLHYIRDVEAANTHIASLQGPVGFDLEWKPTFTKATAENPVALVQLANADTTLLIQVSAMQEFPSNLRDFLESPDFVKAGVAIQYDVKKLYKDYGVSTRNCVDLSLFARSVDNDRWKGKYSSPLGLARLVETYENLLLPKGRITRSNWEDELNTQQIEYAGNDAHAGFVIYERLAAMALSMEKIPKPAYYSFDAVRGRLCEPSGMHWMSYNPDYDPGPPPPPKPPKPPTARDIRRAAAASTFSTISSPSGTLVMATSARYSEHQTIIPQQSFSSQAGSHIALSSSEIQSPPQPYPTRGRRFTSPPNRGAMHSTYSARTLSISGASAHSNVTHGHQNPHPESTPDHSWRGRGDASSRHRHGRGWYRRSDSQVQDPS
ncbi:Werner Syndrome-like exonuclease [Hypsizygus marmoreus]|uniref:3'-5' exonuclease n=1 Tax=Hypsizygus marmoreus TaxID=39966 RepID=A0A369K4L3_HYPMA|nr:Werner Syndrome-like exonuclease [Hypsizygus marmoreus]